LVRFRYRKHLVTSRFTDLADAVGRALTNLDSSLKAELGTRCPPRADSVRSVVPSAPQDP